MRSISKKYTTDTSVYRHRNVRSMHVYVKVTLIVMQQYQIDTYQRETIHADILLDRHPSMLK